MTDVNKEKFELILNYFKSENVDLPTDVRNSIEDVFEEIDNVLNVQLYHLGDLEEFQNDIRLFNSVDIDMRGSHRGITNNTATYYGDIQHSLTEHINLVDEDGIIEEISKLEPNRPARVTNPMDYVVMLWEKVLWESDPEKGKKEFRREHNLYIYCPYNDPELEEENEEENKYDDVYNQLKEGDDYGR